MGPRGCGSGLKRRLVSVGFILAEYRPERSHGDPSRDQNLAFRDFAVTCYYLVVTSYYLVVTNDYLVVTNDYLVVTDD